MIGAGDLVMVVRWPCCGHELGKVSVVKRVDTESFGGECRHCKALHMPCGPIAECDGSRAAPIAWLKRIEPLPESEREPRVEEIAA